MMSRAMLAEFTESRQRDVSSARACVKRDADSKESRKGSSVKLKRTGAIGSPCLMPVNVLNVGERRLFTITAAVECSWVN